jgi:hypothetical protein
MNQHKLSRDYNPNNPIGSTGSVKTVRPIMEQFNKYFEQKLQCSIDPDGPGVPEGAKLYFKKYGYLIINNLWNPKELYCPVPKERGQISYFGSLNNFTHTPEEQQVNGSLARYSHPKYKQIHSQIRLILQDILGEELYNTYYYDRFYFSGQRLIRHKDRDACEISVSVQISSNLNKPWSFCLQTKTGQEIAIELTDGSGLLYMGCDVEHWRDPLHSRHGKLKRIANKIAKKPDDTYWHQIFFHYCRANGPRAHCYLDMIK